MASASISALTQEKILRARGASAKVALLSTEDKNCLLLAIADSLEASQRAILDANTADIENSGMQGAMRDRLLLTPARIKEMAAGVREVAALPDPIGEILAEWTKSNGLHIRKEGSTEFLYLCDTRRGLVVKTTTNGETVFTLGTPTVGSSKSSKRGRWTRAAPRFNRRFMPPEKVATRWPARSSRPTAARTSPTRRFRSWPLIP